MSAPYYSDDLVTLYHGDCREVADWQGGDLLLTDPPYGIGWSRGLNLARGSTAHGGIANDEDTSLRDWVLTLWAARPGIVFGSLYAGFPESVRHVLIWEKPRDAGVVGSTTGYRRDVDAIFLTGDWPRRSAEWGSVVRSKMPSVGNPYSPAGRTGHPHAKPVDLLCGLLEKAPGGTVVDPFAGSGSSLVAAKSMGLCCIGVELDEAHCQTAAQRLSQSVLDFGVA